MKERPILLNGPMVRAILEGRKTQTRRPVKPQPPLKINQILPLELDVWLTYVKPKYGQEDIIRCPYGQPGDRLWVREKFFYDGNFHRKEMLWYTADDTISKGWDWKPSIHMPRWASRITLEIANVRVERVQEISETDAKVEGAQASICQEKACDMQHVSYRDSFQLSWNRIYPGSWDSNDWVWVIEFKGVA